MGRAGATPGFQPLAAGIGPVGTTGATAARRWAAGADFQPESDDM